MDINIKFAQTDPDAKADSAPSIADKQPWANLSIFKQDDFDPTTLPNVMTLENNQAILDGSMAEFPNDPYLYNWGLVTLSQSNAQGVFTIPPMIDIAFGRPHKGLGLTLHFHPWAQDWASSIRVTWYGDNISTIIKSGIYAIYGVVGVVPEPIDGYRRITIEFLSTNIPHRYIRLWNIEYGIIRIFENADIDTANLLEEIDPISDILSINTFGFSIRTHDSEFSPISGDITDDMIMKRQSMTLTADNKPFGVFFLDTWKDVYNNGTVFNFQAMDAVGVMDGYRFMGDIYNNMLASDIIGQLFELCFPTKLIKYKLDTEFATVRLNGHIPICTAREALQYICFAIGAVADTSRHDYVWIYKREISHMQDAEFHTNDIQKFGVIRNISRQTNALPLFMTNESNQAILDASAIEFPNKPENYDFRWWSESICGENRTFSISPILTISFQTQHKSSGFYLYSFENYDSYPTRAKVTWTGNGNTVLHQQEFTFDSAVANVRADVDGYNKIIIEILEMNLQFRFLKIRTIEFESSFYIPRNKQYHGGTIGPTQYFSGVDLMAYEYAKTMETQEIHSGVLEAGQHTFEFSEPLHTITATGAMILTKTANHATINVLTSGTVVLAGLRYQRNERIHNKRVDIAIGQQGNICEFSGATLVDNMKAQTLISELWTYLSQRLILNNEVRLDDLEVGYIAEMATYKRPIIGTIERLDTSLRGGRTKARVIGSVKLD